VPNMSVVAINNFGSVDVLEDDIRTIPEPCAGQVSVGIAAVSFNPIDLYWRAGLLDHKLPVVLERNA
jgi:NADPH:quinone reductase-like Zn-dependent oxidoreductase